jgi:hypothetical protein
MNLDGVGEGAEETNWRVWAEVNGGGADGSKEGPGELARIEAVLAQEQKSLVITQVELGKEQ